MWNLDFSAPLVIEARAFARLPDSYRNKRRSEWCDANKPGHEIDSFLEGPAFDRSGNLFLTDIPFGRIFRVSPAGEWNIVAEYDGWPNGIAINRDGKTGRVYRFSPHAVGEGRLDVVVNGIPSPNGVALDAHGKALFIAVTRANAVWRGALLADRSVSKLGVFRTFFGASGPDGLAVDVENRIVVAHASLGGAFVCNARGEITHFIKSPEGSTVTNVAFRPGTTKLVMTESETGTVLEADLPSPGAPLYSHAVFTAAEFPRP